MRNPITQAVRNYRFTRQKNILYDRDGIITCTMVEYKDLFTSTGMLYEIFLSYELYYQNQVYYTRFGLLIQDPENLGYKVWDDIMDDLFKCPTEFCLLYLAVRSEEVMNQFIILATNFQYLAQMA